MLFPIWPMSETLQLILKIIFGRSKHEDTALTTMAIGL